MPNQTRQSKSNYALFFAGLIVLIAVFALFYFGKSNHLTGMAVGGGGGGCPSINAIPNFLPSNIVGATFSNNGAVSTYTFDSLVNRFPVNGAPGLIQYCVYPSQPPGNPTSATAIATGADGSNFQTVFGAIQGFFAYKRNTGNPSNIPLDGTLGTTIGTASWATNAPSNQIILMHINDPAECDALYGGNPGTCFVYPGSIVQPELCNGDPACKQVIIQEAITTDPFTVPAFTLLHARFTYIIVNQPTNNYNMIFTPPTPSTKDVNRGGAKDHFGCEWRADPFGAPGNIGTYTNYQGTGLTLKMTKTGGTCDQHRFTLTAPTGNPLVLSPGQSLTFTIDMITRKNKGGKQEYTSTGQHLLNSGFTIKWIQSDDGLQHSFTTNPITLTAT